MPIGLQINDYDSDDDISSTEDEVIELQNGNKKNKKLKPKKKKKSILKESKIVKNKAKEQIKSMESEVDDLEFFEYLKEKKEKNNVVSFSNENENEISGFFTNNELKDQLDELDKLKKYQNYQWKTQDFSHHITQSQVITNNIQISMKGLFGERKRQNSRTKILNTTSRVNTRLPIVKREKRSKIYRNIGSMW